MPPIPVHQTFTAMNNGGIILGAFAEEKMIGFLYSFAGYDGKNPYLCSHMLGILPPYRKTGLGVKMKMRQAELAKELGYSMITWTFDPLESKNAYINLHKLGACGAFYHENHYGDLNDQLNQGLPTDRIQVKWDLQVTSRKKKSCFNENNLLLQMDEKGFPLTTNTSDLQNEDIWFMAIPNDFQSLKKNQIDLAKIWRYETRKVFQKLFAVGYVATDLMNIKTEKQSYYVFSNGGLTNDGTN